MRDILRGFLSFASMKSIGDKANPPFFPMFDTIDEHRRAQRILMELDDAKETIDLSDEKFDLLKRVIETNPYRSTRQTMVLDRFDEAEKLEK